MKTKGTANDVAGAIANSTDGTEGADRALGAGRPWVDSGVNMQVCEEVILSFLLHPIFLFLLYFSVMVYIAEHSTL